MPLVDVDTPIAFRSDGVELIERNVDTVLRLRPARAGVAITPSSATVSVYDAAGTTIVDAQAATCTPGSGQAVYTITAATTASLSLEEGWRVEWTPVVSGITYATVVLEAALVRHRIYPTATDQDLYQRVSGLNPASRSPLSGQINDFSSYLDAAWAEIGDRLIAKGDRPWLVMSPQALRRPHILLTLALIFEDFRTRLNPAYEAAAMDYRGQFLDAWNALRFDYDRDQDGLGDGEGATKQAPGGAGVWLGGVMR